MHNDPKLHAIYSRIKDVLYSADSSERKSQRLVDIMVKDNTDDGKGKCPYFHPIVVLVWYIRAEHPWQDVLLQALRLARRLEHVSTLPQQQAPSALYI